MFMWPVLPRSEKQSSQHLTLSLPAEPRFQVRPSLSCQNRGDDIGPRESRVARRLSVAKLSVALLDPFSLMLHPFAKPNQLLHQGSRKLLRF